MAVETGRESTAETTSSSNMFSAWNILVLILVASLLLFWKSWVSLAEVWEQREAYAHGYLIAIISVGLIFRLRPVLKAEQPNPQLTGLLPLSAFVLVWLLMRLAGIQIVELLLLPPILWAACLTVLGWRISTQLALPFFYLYFAIPIWHSGNIVLQSLTVQATEVLVTAAGFLAYIDGNRVFLSSGTFQIADGCSGLNFFIVAVALSVLYGYLYLPNIYRRVALVIIAVIFAVVMNWMRVFIIIYAGYVTDMQHYLVTVDHKAFGWAMFALVLVPIILIARRLEGNPADISKEKVVVPHERVGINVIQKRKTVQALVGVAALLLLASSLEVIKTSSSKTVCGNIKISNENSVWQVNDSVKGDWAPAFIGATSEVLKHYSNGQYVVTLYANLYSEQSQGAELIGYQNKIQGDGSWKKGSSAINKIKLDDDVVWEVREVLLEAGNGNKRVVYFWYVIDGLKSINDLTAKLWQGLFLLTGRPYSGLIAVSSRCEQNDCKVARSSLDNWLEEEWAGSNQALVYLRTDCE